MYHYNTMVSIFIRAVIIITIYDQRNVAPIRNAIRRETDQLDLATNTGYDVVLHDVPIFKPLRRVVFKLWLFFAFRAFSRPLIVKSRDCHLCG